MIDNGMPCVVLRAADFGISGQEAPQDLENNTDLRQRLEALRLACGKQMNLGDVSGKSVPKMTFVSPAFNGGALSTRTFIPHRCHKTIGVLGAVSVATAACLPGSVAYDVAKHGEGLTQNISIEHPSGEMTVIATLDQTGSVAQAAILRTARKLMDGVVFS
jgi:4-oxalomesaconate tautomerase